VVSGGAASLSGRAVRYDRGVASGTLIKGGNEQVLSGGTAVGATVSSGGFLVISSGGTINGATISGATLQIRSGGLTGSVPIRLSGGALVTLDASVSFGSTISGFAQGDFLDLRDINFTSATVGVVEAASNTSGTLTVGDGTHTANILLLGRYVVGQFTKMGDGFGGTIIGDPPLVATTDSRPGALVNPNHT
jgi:autotransporter passenger strand-loop-strand repeat protein